MILLAGVSPSLQRARQRQRGWRDGSFTWTVVRRFIVNQIHSFEPFAAAENNRQVT